MIISYLILVTTLVLLMIIIFLTKKNIKNVGQKIIFLYNNLYIVFIKNYYSNGKQKEEKEEILQYYSNFSKNRSVNNLISDLKKNKKFILEYYSKDIKQISDIYNLLDKYYSYYNSSKKTLLLLLLFTLIVILLLVIFITK